MLPGLERAVSGAVHWNQLPERAARLGVAELVHVTLARRGDGAHLPPEVLRRLERAYYAQAVRNARLGANLQDVLAAFSRHGVRVIVLKGAAIAELVYDNIALRPMGDLDVLVQPRDLELAERLVQELGYVAYERWRPVEWYRRHHHHLAPYHSPDAASYVEVHRHIFPPEAGVQLPIEDLWQRARPADFGPASALVLAPADLLLHLCVALSAVDHFVGGLRTLCDIAAAITRYEEELDWASLLESARAYGVEQHLYYGLWLASSLLTADVPGGVLEQLRRSRGRWVEDKAVKWLTRRAVFRYEGDGSAVPAALIWHLLAELLAAKRGRAKVRGWLRVAYLGFRRLLRRGVTAGLAIRATPRDRTGVGYDPARLHDAHAPCCESPPG
jgi:putative nucleotidyltransferase-like protein